MNENCMCVYTHAGVHTCGNPIIVCLIASRQAFSLNLKHTAAVNRPVSFQDPLVSTLLMLVL